MPTPQIHYVKLGKDAKLYFDSGSDPLVPVFEEICNVGDAELALEKDEEDVTTRCAEGWGQVVYTVKNATFTFTMNHDTKDPGWIKLHDAWLNDTPVHMQVLDGPNTAGSGSEGLDATWAVGKFTAAQPVKGAQRDAIECKPTPGTKPVWYKAPTVVGAMGADTVRPAAGAPEPVAVEPAA